jgi:hypothetical protein
MEGDDKTRSRDRDDIARDARTEHQQKEEDYRRSSLPFSFSCFASRELECPSKLELADGNAAV